MANFIPGLEEIYRLKQKPTNGENVLLSFLENLNDDYYVYFQPFLNGSLPDFIILHRQKGMLIIEVKDWNLDLYNIRDNNWYVNTSHNHSKVKSPLKQVKDYKDHIYSFIDGFVEESIHDSRKYGYVQTAVYFHNATEQEALQLCEECRSYNRWVNVLGKDSLKFDRFRNIHYFRANLHSDFAENYYSEFELLFTPSIHQLEQGKEITYSKEQKNLIVSKKGDAKIKGVAGSGKTFVLAKRAVNAHKRTKGRILILTYNITLRNFIRDKLSQVRDEFPWDVFHIDNYHHFINTMANEYEKETDYEDINLFDGIEIQKYNAVFIDEIQDYKLNWQIIIKKYFLAENGEFVVFGDEKQNIYGTTLEQQDIKTLSEKKEWNVLKESYRLSTIVTDLSLEYFDTYLKDRYQKLEFAIQQELSFNNGFIGTINYDTYQDLDAFCLFIYEYIRENKISRNDVVILGRHICTLREMEFIFRNKYNFQNITKTFESKETFDALNQKFSNQNRVFEEKIREVRRSEKLAFQMSRGTIKMSTIHSFKGWEAENVFLLLEDSWGDGEKIIDEELIYTGITRSKNKLIFLNKEHTKYQDFLQEHQDLVNKLSIDEFNIPI